MSGDRSPWPLPVARVPASCSLHTRGLYPDWLLPRLPGGQQVWSGVSGHILRPSLMRGTLRTASPVATAPGVSENQASRPVFPVCPPEASLVGAQGLL